MRVIICRVFSMRGLNYRGILPRGFKSVIRSSDAKFLGVTPL